LNGKRNFSPWPWKAIHRGRKSRTKVGLSLPGGQFYRWGLGFDAQKKKKKKKKTKKSPRGAGMERKRNSCARKSGKGGSWRGTGSRWFFTDLEEGEKEGNRYILSHATEFVGI